MYGYWFVGCCSYIDDTFFGKQSVRSPVSLGSFLMAIDYTLLLCERCTSLRLDVKEAFISKEYMLKAKILCCYCI